MMETVEKIESSTLEKLTTNPEDVPPPTTKILQDLVLPSSGLMSQRNSIQNIKFHTRASQPALGYEPNAIPTPIKSIEMTLDRAVPEQDLNEISKGFRAIQVLKSDIEELKNDFLHEPDTPHTRAAFESVKKSIEKRIEYSIGVQPVAYIDPEPQTLTNNSNEPISSNGITVPPDSQVILSPSGANYTVVTPASHGTYRWLVNANGTNDLKYTLQTYSGVDLATTSEITDVVNVNQYITDFPHVATTATNSYVNWHYGNYDCTTSGQWVTIGSCEDTGATATWSYITCDWTWTEKETAAEKLKRRIRRQLSGQERSRPYLAAPVSPAEQRARDTLRDMISEAEWRRYVTNSFVMVRGNSGRHYQVFSNHNRRIQVWEKGKHIANLCIHTHPDCPPSDHVINMKIMVELDEDALWKDSNIFWQNGHTDSQLLAV